MTFFNKVYRTLISYKNQVASALRIIHFKLKYPSLHIDFKSYLSTQCNIVCVDGAQCDIKNCHFAQGVYIVIEKDAVLKLSDSSFGPQTVIVAKEYIEIKSHCSVAEMVVIRDQNHQFGNNRLIKDSGYDTGKICIEENVWIGAKATVCPGITCKSHSVLAVGSVATKDLEPYHIYQGNPAVIVKKRTIAYTD